MTSIQHQNNKLTSLMSAEYLLETHAPGTTTIHSPGYDLLSKDEVVIAETFSAVSPIPIIKLKKYFNKISN